MKKVLAMVLGMVMMFNTSVLAASGPSVSFTIEGNVKKGDKITIYVTVKQVVRLYAASVEYTYNPEDLKVTYIGGADLIENTTGIMELGGDTEKDGNRARYQMTFTGKVHGLSGAGNLVRIEAEVLKDCNITLKEDNMKVKLVRIDDEYTVSNMEFKYESFTTDIDEEKPLNTEEDNVKPSEPNENPMNEEQENNKGKINGESSNLDPVREPKDSNDSSAGNEINITSNIDENAKEDDDKEDDDKKDDDKKDDDKEDFNGRNSNGLYVAGAILIIGLAIGIYVIKKGKK